MHIEVYLGDFICIMQGGTSKIQKMTRHLFRAFGEILYPNNDNDTVHEQQILIKKLCKGNAFWSTQKVILGWAINTVEKSLTLPLDRKGKITSLLDSVTLSALIF